MPRKQALPAAGVVSTGEPATQPGSPIAIWGFLAGALTMYVDSPTEAPEDMLPFTVVVALSVVTIGQSFWLPQSSHIWLPSFTSLGRASVFAVLLSGVATCTIPTELLFKNAESRAGVGILPFFLQGVSIGVFARLLGGARYLAANTVILTATMIVAFVRLDSYLHSNETYGDPRVLVGPYAARPLGLLVGGSGSHLWARRPAPLHH